MLYFCLMHWYFPMWWLNRSIGFAFVFPVLFCFCRKPGHCNLLLNLLPDLLLPVQVLQYLFSSGGLLVSTIYSLSILWDTKCSLCMYTLASKPWPLLFSMLICVVPFTSKLLDYWSLSVASSFLICRASFEVVSLWSYYLSCCMVSKCSRG